MIFQSISLNLKPQANRYGRFRVVLDEVDDLLGVTLYKCPDETQVIW